MNRTDVFLELTKVFEKMFNIEKLTKEQLHLIGCLDIAMSEEMVMRIISIFGEKRK